MNSSPKTRIHFVQRSVTFAFAAIERRYERLCYLLQHYHVDCQDDEIVSLAWDIIDWAERLRTLLHHGIGVKASDPWLQWFTRELAPVESMRHIIQHLPGSVEECLREKSPLFGYVWAYCSSREDENSYDIIVAVASPLSAQDNANLRIFGKIEIDFHPPVDQVCFQVGKHRMNLTNFMMLVRDGHMRFDQRTITGQHNKSAGGDALAPQA